MDRVSINQLEFSPAKRRWWELRLRLGRWLNSYVTPYRDLDLVQKRAYVKRARSPGDRLTAEEVASLSNYMINVQDRDIRREYFRTTPLERTFQGQVVPLVASALENDPAIHSVLDIGTHYAFIDHHLAERFPGVQFAGVDFAVNLAEFNAEFARPNLAFVSGYAMDLLERGQLDPDLVFFSCTAYEIKTAEVRRYLRVLAKRRRTVVFSEPIYPMPGGRIVDPMTAPADEAVPVFSLPTHLPGQYGPLALVHNYRAIAAECGYEILHYRAFKPEFTDLRMVQLIARAPGPDATP
jgi:hypothetical protein